jgi:hypothetical protein
LSIVIAEVSLEQNLEVIALGSDQPIQMRRDETGNVQTMLKEALEVEASRRGGLSLDDRQQ